MLGFTSAATIGQLLELLTFRVTKTWLEKARFLPTFRIVVLR
jgi:hypothetical protein